MRVINLILTSLLVILLLPLIACEPQEQFQEVTIGELISNTSAYNGQQVAVSGQYIDIHHEFCQRICPCVEYPPCTDIEIREELDKYHPFCYSRYGISDNDGAVAFSIDDNGNQGALPTFSEGQPLIVEGTVHSTTIEIPQCNPCVIIIRSSLVINVRPADIRLLPSPTPTISLTPTPSPSSTVHLIEAYDYAKKQIQTAVDTYMDSNQGQLPPIIGDAPCADGDTLYIFDICFLFDVPWVPDCCIILSGKNNDNCDGGTCWCDSPLNCSGCTLGNHYLWYMDTNGTIGSTCIGDECWDSGVDGYQGVWP